MRASVYQMDDELPPVLVFASCKLGYMNTLNYEIAALILYVDIAPEGSVK